MSPPQFIANSSIADEAGWVNLYMYTLRHETFANIFGVGDCTSLPTSRTGAAIRKQAPVVVENLLAMINDKDRKSTRLNSSHVAISYAVFCLKKKTPPPNCHPSR